MIEMGEPAASGWDERRIMPRARARPNSLGKVELGVSAFDRHPW